MGIIIHLVAQTVKNPPVMQETWAQFLSGEDPLVHGNPLQHSCLDNPMDRGAWRVIVHGVTKSWAGLSDLAHATHTALSK